MPHHTSLSGTQKGTLAGGRYEMHLHYTSLHNQHQLCGLLTVNRLLEQQQNNKQEAAGAITAASTANQS
jgi:hypothetical protein